MAVLYCKTLQTKLFGIAAQDERISSMLMQVRAMVKAQKAGKYGKKVARKGQRRQHSEANQITPDPINEIFK